MKITSTRNQSCDLTAEITYPWAGIYTDTNGSFVVLFEAPAKGVVIQSTHPTRTLGMSSCNWSTCMYKPFYGRITLNFSP